MLSYFAVALQPPTNDSLVTRLRGSTADIAAFQASTPDFQPADYSRKPNPLRRCPAHPVGQ
jgi:hypothetical protein